MNKITGILMGIGIMIGGWWGTRAPPPPNSIKYQVLSIRDETPTPTPDTPQILIIPRLGVRTNIETVGKDKQGLMDVPKVVSNAAWYELGVKPGEKGNSVIAGHLNNPELKPEIFYHLEQLEPGDQITVIDNSHKEWNFQVTRTEKLPDKDFPVEEVFGPSNQNNLNLITCGGEWDKALGTYNERVVVFTQLTDN